MRWTLKRIRGGYALYLDGELAATSHRFMALIALACEAQGRVMA